MRRTFLLAFLTLAPWPVAAQDWATREFCEVDTRPVMAADFAPLDLQALEAAAAAIPNGVGRFWRIESPEGAVSHLWGTYHTSAPAILDLPDSVRETIAEARVVALEADFTFPDRASYRANYDQPGRYRDASDPFESLDPLDLSFLSADTETAVYNRMIEYFGYEDTEYVLTYGGLAEALLADPCEDFFAGIIPIQDDYIHTLARIAGAEVIGLEPADAFLAYLADQPETAKAIITVYASYLDPPPNQAARTASFTLYLEGRLGLLSAWEAAHLAARDGPSGTEALAKTDAYLLDHRNAIFVERLEPEIGAGGVFIAVGAGHLPGANGLVTLLENEGFKVTRVPLRGEVE